MAALQQKMLKLQLLDNDPFSILCVHGQGKLPILKMIGAAGVRLLGYTMSKYNRQY